jgi:hypothetical protein
MRPVLFLGMKCSSATKKKVGVRGKFGDPIKERLIEDRHDAQRTRLCTKGSSGCAVRLDYVTGSVLTLKRSRSPHKRFGLFVLIRPHCRVPRPGNFAEASVSVTLRCVALLRILTDRPEA